jgi:hypothetical protein
MRVIRLLLHSADATYDDASKVYHFNLDDRLDWPIRLRIMKCHYANHTDGIHPLVVYLRSDTLSNLIKTKHTLRCKDQNHEEYENILCTLQESHQIGRYSLDINSDRRQFVLEHNRFIRSIDFMFSDNDALLSKSATAAQVVASGSADDILAIGDELVAFIDFGTGRVQDQSFTNVSTAGDTVYYIRNRGSNTELMFSNSYGNGGQLANFGGNGAISVTRQGSWESYLDSWPMDQADMDSQYCIHTLIMLTDLNFTYIIDTGFIKLLVWNQQLAYVDANDQKQGVMQFSPMVPYLLTVRRHEVDQANHNLEWRLENLTDNSVTTAQSGSGLSTWPNANGFSWRIGHASTHFSHLQSAFIVHNTLNATWQAESQAYLRNYHDGTTSPAEENTQTTTTDSRWFVELELQLRN